MPANNKGWAQAIGYLIAFVMMMIGAGALGRYMHGRERDQAERDSARKSAATDSVVGIRVICGKVKSFERITSHEFPVVHIMMENGDTYRLLGDVGTNMPPVLSPSVIRYMVPEWVEEHSLLHAGTGGVILTMMPVRNCDQHKKK
ncbi:hypothetical protein KW800_02640 [Candidatus Parcubacteria bacterium]|nr:hypothetical protein [Candidatus Parcubacteria bacterium]